MDRHVIVHFTKSQKPCCCCCLHLLFDLVAMAAEEAGEARAVEWKPWVRGGGRGSFTWTRQSPRSGIPPGCPHCPGVDPHTAPASPRPAVPWSAGDTESQSDRARGWRGTLSPGELSHPFWVTDYKKQFLLRLTASTPSMGALAKSNLTHSSYRTKLYINRGVSMLMASLGLLLHIWQVTH